MYRQIRTGEAQAGDVLKVAACVYDENIYSKKWGLHFVIRNQFFVIDSVSNNGTVKACSWALKAEDRVA